ncbi:DEKNAAC100110 [Brettanomyces naardenensis]|uniref:DEKNAAC100110 n=1 Tax=Brettanomyces naardenensis TaxID=13370 RepID=A0A448YEV1_BRENA|nr:DEKNAAC100110 [Brettanomyces naardenensis]
MFYSEQLLSKDGPLAYAWLAANLEKKLTKQQLLNASVTESARAIEDSSRALDISSSQREVEPMALRLSGQLLYGIVRIYSRKAKYLYEDVNDILMKLKASFATSKSVLLPLESTVIPSIKTVTLADTVTEADLLYRRPFSFDEIFGSQRPISQPRVSELAVDNEEDTFPADESIELPRRDEQEDELDAMGDTGDLDLDLNFDIGDHEETRPHSPHQEEAENESIEVGRAPLDEPNASAIDTIGEIELPDFEEPILEIDNGEENDGDEPSTPPDMTAPTRSKRTQRQLNYQKTDVVRTAKRRIVVDAVTEISAQALRANQRRYMESTQPVHRKHGISPEQRARQFVGNAASYFAGGLHLEKRRRIVETRVTEPEAELNELPLEVAEEQTEQIEQIEPAQQAESTAEFEPDFDDIDVAPQSPVGNLSIDLGEVANDELESNEGEEEEDVSVQAVEEKATSHVAGCLKSMLTADDKVFDGVAVTLDDVLDVDKKGMEPLSKNAKTEVTKTFFELLVLAGSDAVKLSQDRLFGEISIEAKDALTSFV